MKTCFRCLTPKPLDEFYAHPAMADGHLNKCKCCTRADNQQNRAAKRDYYVAYDQLRHQRPERRAKALVYQLRRRDRLPEKYRARTYLGNAIRDGRVRKQPCEVCGSSKVEAHHHDYSKPLDVRWLCFKHHRQAHGQLTF